MPRDVGDEDYDAMLRVEIDTVAEVTAYLAGREGLSPALATWAVEEVVDLLVDPEVWDATERDRIGLEAVDHLHYIDNQIPRVEKFKIRELCEAREEKERPGNLPE